VTCRRDARARGSERPRLAGQDPMAHVGLSFGAAASQWHSVGSGLPRSVFRVPVRRVAWLPGWACASQAEGPAFGLIAPVFARAAPKRLWAQRSGFRLVSLVQARVPLASQRLTRNRINAGRTVPVRGRTWTPSGVKGELIHRNIPEPRFPRCRLARESAYGVYLLTGVDVPRCALLERSYGLARP
jgi:hypothetical protein